MSSDFDKPALDDTYVNVLPDIRDNQKANALMFNGISVTNIPVGAVQYAGGVFGVWNGSSFPVKAVVIGGGGTGATTAAGARTNLSLSSVAEANALYMKVLSNGSDINDVSIFRDNIDVYSTSQVYTQTEVDNIVEFSSQAQAEAGTDATSYMNPLRTSQAIQAIGRDSVVVWTGSDTSISTTEILASSGHTVSTGTYFIKASSGITWTVSIPTSSSDRVAGSSFTDGIIIDYAQFGIAVVGSFSVFRRTIGGGSSGLTINEIRFIPL